MFVALTPPAAVIEDLEEFLAPRQEAGPGFRWTSPEQWHVTLSFMPVVADHQIDELEERLARAARRRTPFDMAVAGGGAFPDPGRAKVIFAGVEPTSADAGEELRRLSRGARAAASKSGAVAEGGRFHPHVTLARTARPVEASRWLRVLEAYRSPSWRSTQVNLVESHLGEGPRRRPRYEVRAAFPLGSDMDASLRPETTA